MQLLYLRCLCRSLVARLNEQVPMKTLKTVFTIFLVLGAFCLQGQVDICECCSYSSLQYRKSYEDIFPPNLIQNKEILEVVVNTQGETKYREMKFKFDKNGYVISRTGYNRMGQPHSIYEYDRDETGRVTKRTFTYLDSLENKLLDFSWPEIIDFTYDKNNRLKKSKERDIYGNIIKDSKTTYTSYKYDNRGRVIKKISYYYFGFNIAKPSKYITRFTYKDSEFKGESKTYINGRLFLTSKIDYNKNWKSLKEDDYNNLVNKVSSETNFLYDSLDRLTTYDTKSGDGSSSECPDGGTYTEKYVYGDDGLLYEIIHTYGTVKCTMTFEYK